MLTILLKLLTPWAEAAVPQAGTVLWTFNAGSPISSSPAVAPDGTVYVGVAGFPSAITNSGVTASNKWTFPVGMNGTGALGADGTVFFGGTDGNLYALDTAGQAKWSYPIGGAGSSPAVGAENTVYVTASGTLYAIAASGSLKWKAGISTSVNYLSPAVAPDGTIYVATWDTTTLYAFDQTGKQKWTAALASRPSDSPAIDGKGMVYISAGPLYAFSSDGSNVWTSAYDQLDGSPVLAPDGIVYASGYGTHALFAFSPAGTMNWVVGGASSHVPSTTAALDSAGTIYYCVSNSVWAMNSQGQVQWAVTAPGDPGPGNFFATTSPSLSANGVLYAALGNTLYAIASGTNGPAKSLWPMYRANAQHTGSSQRPILKQPQKRSDSNFQFELYPQQLGLTYTIQFSTNLRTWGTLTSVVANTLPTDVTDLTATNAPFRFYRAMSVH